MRQILCGLLGATMVIACSASDSETVSVDTTAPALGSSATVDTPLVTLSEPSIDTSRAALIAARRTATRPAVVYHGTDEQKALSDLRLQKSKTTYRRLEPLKRPATNR